ncbi:MAG: UPF0175 family protein [Thaumarchaeota archaeon]|nr:UPF0175 family protein [Nitrososphaerota archaeon]MCL5318519.1 UPF0175 family protein [Nitrososphaerota archaeon]
MAAHSETKHLTGRINRKQLEQLDEISKEEKIDRSAALRKILEIGIGEYLKRKAVDDYRRGRVSIGKAAEIANVSIAEFYKILKDEDVPVKIDVSTLKDSLE